MRQLTLYWKAAHFAMVNCLDFAPIFRSLLPDCPAATACDLPEAAMLVLEAATFCRTALPPAHRTLPLCRGPEQTPSPQLSHSQLGAYTSRCSCSNGPYLHFLSICSRCTPEILCPPSPQTSEPTCGCTLSGTPSRPSLVWFCAASACLGRIGSGFHCGPRASQVREPCPGPFGSWDLHCILYIGLTLPCVYIVLPLLCSVNRFL